MSGRLETEIKNQLGDWTKRYAISTTVSFADLVWDADMKVDEILRLDPVVIVDSLAHPRRIVMQRIRNEIRYWLTTDRDPYSASSSDELGKLASLAAAVELCEEFLNGESATIELLRSRRWSHGVWKGAS